MWCKRIGKIDDLSLRIETIAKPITGSGPPGTRNQKTAKADQEDKTRPQSNKLEILSGRPGSV